MAQVKSEAVRHAILSSGERLFAEKGFIGTTINAIAREAGTSPANVYVYFASKLEIAFAIYEPWFRRALLDIKAEVARTPAPRDKIRRLLDGLWRRIPSDKTGLSHIFIEAITFASGEDHYQPSLLRWAEDIIAQILADCRAPDQPPQQSDKEMAHVLMMAFDGFVVNERISRTEPCDQSLIETMADMILARPGASRTDAAPVHAVRC
jgi:AcrR family transcriptional regulator